MKNIIKTISVVVVLGLSMLAFTGEAFAAASILPNSVVEITTNSALIKGYVENYAESSVVWFEWSEASSASAPVVVSMKNFFSSGFFEARLTDLRPDTVYSFRSAVKTRETTIYSPVSSFRTRGVAVAGSVSSQSALGLGTIVSGGNSSTVPNQGSSANTTQRSSSNTQTQKVSSQNKNTTSETVVAKNTSNTNYSNSSSGYSSNNKNVNTTSMNSNTASVIGAGAGVFPSTLVGWLALFVAILVIVLLIHMIFEQGEKRKKRMLPHELEMAGMIA